MNLIYGVQSKTSFLLISFRVLDFLIFHLLLALLPKFVELHKSSGAFYLACMGRSITFVINSVCLSSCKNPDDDADCGL